jgi:predicted metallopeptidase
MKKSILLLALVFISFSFSYKKEFYNTLSLSENNIVNNRTNLKYLDTIVKVGLDSLGVKNVVVVINKINELEKEVANSNMSLSAILIVQKPVYLIKVNSKTINIKTIEVIAHELIHIKQYEENRLFVDSKNVFWNGIDYSNVRLEYHNLPWEVEAFKQDDILANKIRKTLIKK